MAQDSVKWDWRPAWKLATAIVIGLTLVLVALAWPAMVRGDSHPVITQVEVKSSKNTFFYSPPLDDSGGTVYFNNLSGEGADQIITVTVTVSDANPIRFDGGSAFGITPSTNISTSYGATSTWSVTYTIGASDASENGVVFTVTDSLNSIATTTITFTQDITDPGASSPTISENSPYLHAVSGGIYYGDKMTTPVPFTVTGNANDEGAGLNRATFSTAVGDTPPDDTTPTIWTGVYTAGSGNTDQGIITVTVYDKVGNSIVQTFAYTRDIQGPGMVFNFLHVPDTDSGNDGFDPDTDWEDDLTADLTWEAPNDSGGSGIAGYHLNSSPTSNTAFYTITNGSLTVNGDGAYNILIRAQDNVGNLGSTNFAGPIQFDQNAPKNGHLDLVELSGGEYLYIANDTNVTTGTLFYNNAAASSFIVTADDTDVDWGEGSVSWKVAFSPGWGESSISEDTSSPFEHTYSIVPFETTDVFTVYFVNRAGNVLSLRVDAELDTSTPVITFTSVVAPDWDADGDTSDYTNYWYRTGGLTGGWGFTTDVITEQVGVDSNVGWAYWDHSSGTAYDQNQAAPGGDGSFTGVSDDADGAVMVTVVITDRVNNVGSVAMTLNLDNTPPLITPTGWSEGSPYLHIIGDELFFSHMMPAAQEAQLSGDAADNPGGSGLDRAEFSLEDNLAGSPSPDYSPANWSGNYAFANDSTQGDGLAVITVYDHVSNFATDSFSYTLDATPPVVTFTNVTDPGYDPVPPEEDTEGNWYASSDFNAGPFGGGWDFNFVFDESQAGARLARADWDHSSDATDRLNYDPGLDGQGRFSAVNNDADGVVTVTLRVEDNVGNVGSDILKLRIDKTPPTIINGSWSETVESEFLHADGSTLYFSHQMGSPQQATLSGQANDGTGSGPDRIRFSNESNLASSPGPDDTPADWSGNYAFDNSSGPGDGTVVVTLEDKLYGHLNILGRPDSPNHVSTKPYTYVLDIIPPTTPANFTITTPPVFSGYYNTRSLNLSWVSSTDNITGSGLLGYYVGNSNPPSASFYPPPATTASFNTGSDGTFPLYLAAKDNVGNASLASTSPITVDTQGPIASVTGSVEEANRRFLVQWSANDSTTWPVNYDVQYQVNNGAWKPWLSATTATSRYFGPNDPETVETGTIFRFRVRARDYVNNLGGWSPVWTGTTTLRFAYLPILLKNFDTSIPFFVSGNFETGTFAGWKTEGVLQRSIVTHPVRPTGGTPPNGGTYAALLGSPSYGCFDSGPAYIPIGQASMKAYANVPDSGTPFLRFHYRVLSYDTVKVGQEWWDRLEVQVNGTPLARYGDPDPGSPQDPFKCSKLYDSQWLSAEFNLSAYKGQTILLTFFNENHKDGYWNTYSYLDNIRIEVGP